MAGDGETVTPSLPEPDVWTGTACADVSGPLRWKRAKTIEARGGDVVQPHQEAGYTSAVVAVDPDQASRCNRAGSIYVHTAHRVRWHSAAKREVEQKWCHSGAPPPLTIAES